MGTRANLFAGAVSLCVLACAPAVRPVETPIVIVSAPAPLPPGATAPHALPEPPRALAIVGVWKEHWGDGSLGYHDRYRVRVRDGIVVVEPIGGTYEIGEVRGEDASLSFVQQTAFAVRYTLRADPASRELVGSATTPDGTYPIRWERLADDPDAEATDDGEDK